MHEKFVYFIQCISDGIIKPIKIGVAVDVELRLSALQSCNPFELKLILKIKGNMRHEKALHRYLKNEKIRGEWYKNSELVNKTIGELSWGDFNWNKLPSSPSMEKMKEMKEIFCNNL